MEHDGEIQQGIIINRKETKMSKFFNIGSTLRALRYKEINPVTDKPLTLRYVEDKVNAANDKPITFQQLSDWEKGKHEPNLDVIYKIVKACNSTMIEFFKLAEK